MNGWFVFCGLMAVSCAVSEAGRAIAHAIPSHITCDCGKGAP